MFGIVSRRSGQRNFYAAGMEEVSMRSFTSPIDKPMRFQVGDELPNLTRHKTLSSKMSTFKATPKQVVGHFIQSSPTTAPK
jgi:hypothetical protein